MAVVQVIADRPGAGKTCLAGALLTRLIRGGQKAGYYKPFSPSPEDDLDVDFVSQHLLASGDSPQVTRGQAMPEAIGPDTPLPDDLVGEIRSAIAKLEAAAELVMVDGPDLHPPLGDASRLCYELAAGLDTRILLLFRYTGDLDAATISSAGGPFGDRLAGVVINGVPLYRHREVNDELLGDLRSRGIPVLGSLPEDRAMLGVTVQQIADYLSGSWVQEPVNTDVLVDRFLIGGNIMDSGSIYFGRFDNQAVITRAQRPDIQLASLMAATQCLVLTGGSEPSDYIKAEALQRDVPMVLVQEDTMATAEALGGLIERANAYSRYKIERCAGLMEQHLDLALLDAALS